MDGSIPSGWRELFGLDSAREILRRIVDGDPIELEARCRSFLIRRCFLVSLERMLRRTQARVAFEASCTEEVPLPGPWVELRMRESLFELLEEDREGERAGLPPEDIGDSLNHFLSSSFGIEPHLVRGATVRFNALPRATRAAFFLVAVEKRTLADWAAAGHGRIEDGEQTLVEAVLALAPDLELGGGGPSAN